uniref:Uncharacterized protein n=1 Tax=Leersia perrieri TaxID=77586 RepID=A0A0D9VRJ3_9ORYZ
MAWPQITFTRNSPSYSVAHSAGPQQLNSPYGSSPLGRSLLSGDTAAACQPPASSPASLARRRPPATSLFPRVLRAPNASAAPPPRLPLAHSTSSRQSSPSLSFPPVGPPATPQFPGGHPESSPLPGEAATSISPLPSLQSVIDVSKKASTVKAGQEDNQVAH